MTMPCFPRRQALRDQRISASLLVDKEGPADQGIGRSFWLSTKVQSVFPLLQRPVRLVFPCNEVIEYLDDARASFSVGRTSPD